MLNKRDSRENISLSNIDYVPYSVPERTSTAKLIIMEDNEAVIQMTKKGRSPNMRHVVRTHRVSLDWLWARLDPHRNEGISLRWVEISSHVEFQPSRLHRT